MRLRKDKNEDEDEVKMIVNGWLCEWKRKGKRMKTEQRDATASANILQQSSSNRHNNSVLTVQEKKRNEARRSKAFYALL